MDVFYDFEFLEDGRTIEPISLGMVRDDGEELYLVNRNIDFSALAVHDWLTEHVVPHLPVARMENGTFVWNTMHPDWDHVVRRAAMPGMIQNFLYHEGNARPDLQLWGWYSAYDHVALAQMFGPMVKLPEGIPMWTNDLKQEHVRLGRPELPAQSQTQLHNALADARQIRAWAEFLAEYRDERTPVTLELGVTEAEYKQL